MTAGTSGGAPSASAGPPSWVRAGTRITYYEAAASVQSLDVIWIEDPNGTWVDSTSGKHYRRADESSPVTAGGDGVSQYDILAADAGSAVVSNTLYGIDRASNLLVAAGSAGGTVTGPTLDGVWINPATLGALARQQIGGVMVLAGPYPLGDKTYQAVAFVSTSANAYQSYTYDTATGLLLARTTRSGGASATVGVGQSPNSQLTTTLLAGVRQRSVPGLAGANPAWVGRTTSLQYSGSYTFVNPVDPSSAQATYPMSLSVTFGSGDTWIPFTARQQVQMPGAQQGSVTGVTGPAGLYWMDTAALSGLRTGQVLDTDPITTESMTVGTADAATVTISDALPGVTTAAVYDRTSGALTAFSEKLDETGATIALQLQTRP